MSHARVLFLSTEAIRLENMIQYVLARLFEYRLRHTFQPYPTQGLDKVGDGVFFSEDSQVEMFSHLSLTEENTSRCSFDESLCKVENSFCVLFRVSN
jgi:hypothetical protein